MIFFFILSQVATSLVISTTVGQVKDHVVTSREVHLHQMLLQKQVSSVDVTSAQALSVITDYALYLEAENFHLGTVSEKEILNTIEKLQKKIAETETTKALQFSDREIRKAAEVYLRAQSLMNFKVKSSTTAISEVEVQNYFDQNRSKFGNATFDTFKTNIKAYLVRTQLENRLREWLESLQIKYAIKNFT